MIEVVIDASVAVKWFLPEPLSDDAHLILNLLRRRGIRAWAPDLIVVEVASVLWRRTRSKQERLPGVEASAALAALLNSPLDLEPDRNLVAPAFELSGLIPCTVYDGLYVALAVRENARLITADAALVRECKRHGLYSYVVELPQAASLLMS